MFSSAAATIARSFSTSSASRIKVAVLGASGGIGKPLSMLLKLNPAVSQLAMYDIVHTTGVAADLSHIETACRVTGYVGGAHEVLSSTNQLEKALKGARIVVVPAGVPRMPGMTRDDLFNTNASVVANLSAACAKDEVVPGGRSICLKYFWLRFIRKFQNAESRSQRKGEEGREEGGPASHGRR